MEPGYRMGARCLGRVKGKRRRFLVSGGTGCRLQAVGRTDR